MESIAEDNATPSDEVVQAAEPKPQLIVNLEEPNKEDNDPPEKNEEPNHEQDNNNKDGNNESEAMKGNATVNDNDSSKE